MLRAAMTSCLALAWVGGLGAQELEPGLYQNVPAGLHAATLGYGFSTGNILLDSSLPLADADAQIHSVLLGYVRTLGVGGLAAKLDLQTPLSWGQFEGTVAGVHRTRSPSGLADPRVRFMVNFIGAPALAGPDFATYRQGTVVGAGIQVRAPPGAVRPGAPRQPRLQPLVVPARARRVAEAGALLPRARRRRLVVHAQRRLLRRHDARPGAALLREGERHLQLQAPWALAVCSTTAGPRAARRPWVASPSRTSRPTTAPASRSRCRSAGRDRSSSSTRTACTTRLGADFDSWSVAYQRSWGGRARPAR